MKQIYVYEVYTSFDRFLGSCQFPTLNECREWRRNLISTLHYHGFTYAYFKLINI